MDSSVSSIIVERGFKLPLELAQSVSANELEMGQTVLFRVPMDIYKGDTVVFKADSIARGLVQQVKKQGRCGAPAELTIVIENVDAVDGNQIPIHGTLAKKGKSHYIRVTILFVLLFPIGFPVLLQKGGPAVLAKGTPVEATVQKPMTISLYNLHFQAGKPVRQPPPLSSQSHAPLPPPAQIEPGTPQINPKWNLSDFTKGE